MRDATKVWYNMIMDLSKISDFGSFGTPELLIMAGLGLAVLLFGYRIKKIAFFIIWFILGYNLMALLMPTINGWIPEVAESQLYQTLLPIAGGILLAMMGFSIEKLCVGGICFALVMLIVIRYFGTEMQTIAVGGIVGVIAAGAAVVMMKPAVIVATAAAGAYAITLAILRLAENLDFGAYYWPMIIGITAIGALFQFVTTKRVS